MNEIYKKKENFVTDAYEWFQNYLKFIDVNMQYEYKNTLVNTYCLSENTILLSVKILYYNNYNLSKFTKNKQ